MNGNSSINKTNGCNDDKKPDLLAHRYRPDCVDRVRCHSKEALRLKTWIQEFIDLSNGTILPNNPEFNDDSSASESNLTEMPINNRCVLLTGPPGVGKTSLVYTIAKELKLHVVESHSSEKRDSKLFSMLKLTNQKGKINPIAKLFSFTNKQQEQRDQHSARRKRRKLWLAGDLGGNKQSSCLSLSGDTSIILFDDIDVIFEEDGPFLKSLNEFIKESKRPVVLTATKSIDSILHVLGEQAIEHIHLNKPAIDDCAKLLENICEKEQYNELRKTSGCHIIANFYDCDIRQCLNSIHFYGDQAERLLEINFNSDRILPEFSKLNPAGDGSAESENGNKLMMNCYTSSSLVDLMDAKFNLTARSRLLELWLEGKPSFRNEEHSFGYDLGEQIRDSIFELSRKVHINYLKTDQELIEQRETFTEVREQILNSSLLVNSKIKSRIEPPEKEFFTDIVPMFSEIANLDLQQKKASGKANSVTWTRRSQRSYFDTICIYLDVMDTETIMRTLLKPELLTSE